MNLQLKDKRILLTGSEGFLGQHIRNALIQAGAEVIGVDVVETEQSKALNITNYKDVSAFFNNNEKYYGLINCAAVSYKGINISEDQFNHTIDVNIKGTHNMMMGIKSNLIDGGNIVNISSIYGSLSPNPKIYNNSPELFNSSIYGATKASINQLTRYYATMWAPIRVNSIAPGGIFQGHDDNFTRSYSEYVPLKRMAAPEEIVYPILFLLSPLSSYITGQNWNITGGLEIL